MVNFIKRLRNKIYPYYAIDKKNKLYLTRFKRFSFYGTKCIDEKQYEAVITRLQHTIEKGLAYLDYRAGFGKNNISALLASMENYLADGYSRETFFFQTALSTLLMYISKNKEYGIENIELENHIKKLGETKSKNGGVIKFLPLSPEEIKTLGYKDFVKSRHSMRHFSKESVDVERVERAVQLAQYTPSACNRQGWKTIIISNKRVVKEVCANQNGNEGFGHEFDKMLLITADLRCFNRDRELYQAFIDGGMYAENILNALHYEHIASVPLSASFNEVQEMNMRKLLNLHEAEVLILLIGIGNYPEICQTARSERKQAEYIIV